MARRTDDDFQHEIDLIIDQIKASDVISDADRDALLEYNRELRRMRSRTGVKRRRKNLQHLKVLAGEFDREKANPDDPPEADVIDILSDEDAVGTFLDWIHSNYTGESTNRDYRGALRSFAKHVTDGDEVPEPADQIPAGTSRNHNPMPDPAKMFRWDEHVLPMIQAASNLRDAAMVAVSWDSGARSSEIRGLRIGDISDHKYGKKISLSGKKGERSVILVSSVPYLKKWLDVHPAQDDASAPVWSKLRRAEEPSYRTKLKMLKEPAKGTDVTLPAEPTFTRMRKSSASYLASQGISQAHLEDHHGWKRGSDIAARYVSVFTDANDRAVAAAHGVDVADDETDPIGPMSCPRCERETPRSEDFCVWCEQSLNPEAARQAEEFESDVFERMRDIDDPETLNRLIDMAEVVSEHPDVGT
jgi:integrase